MVFDNKKNSTVSLFSHLLHDMSLLYTSLIANIASLAASLCMLSTVCKRRTCKVCSDAACAYLTCILASHTTFKLLPYLGIMLDLT